MNTFKSVALTLAAAGAIAGPLAIATPSMANDQSISSQGQHRVDQQQIAERSMMRPTSAYAADQAAAAPRQCENVEAFYAAAKKAYPAPAPGNASNWDEWTARQDSAIASAPVCS